MEAGFIALLIVMTLIGILAGMLVEKTKTKRRDNRVIAGTLNVVMDDPDSGPDLFLALDVPIADIASRRLAVFSVNILQDDSHE